MTTLKFFLLALTGFAFAGLSSCASDDAARMQGYDDPMTKGIQRQEAMSRISRTLMP